MRGEPCALIAIFDLVILESDRRERAQGERSAAQGTGCNVDELEFIMSEQVQSFVEAVRGMHSEQRRELTAGLAAMDFSRPVVSSGRKKLVESIRGKYRQVPTSSESFVIRKREDTTLEFKP